MGFHAPALQIIVNPLLVLHIFS